jgi:hypothetical protein
VAITDANLRALREIDLLHALPLMKVDLRDTIRRPGSAAEVLALDLRNTEVTDAGLKELAPLKNLATLDLRRTRVTDAGLKELAPLKNLTSVMLPTSISEQAAAALQKLLPNCKVARSP